MEKINFAELEPITEMCSIFVNISEPLDLKKIRESINLSMLVYVCGNIEHDPEWTMGKNEYWLMKLSLEMEMIMRNIILNDENAIKLTDSQLEGYLMGKAYILTGHYPPVMYIKSVIKLYREFAKASHNHLKS